MSVGEINQRATLYADMGPLAGRSFPLDHSPLTIGRSEGNDVVVPDVPVSRQHAQIEERTGRWWLTDLSSSNGTFLNHQRITVSQPLHDGDIIGMGESAFRFSLGPGSWRAATTTPASAPQQAGVPPAAARSSRTLLIVTALLAVLVLILIVVVVAILGRGAESKATTETPLEPGLETPAQGAPPGFPAIDAPTGVPPIEFPSGIPSIEVPTGIPSMEIPTGLPTGLPSLDMPSGIQTGLPAGLPTPTGGIEIPQIQVPAGTVAGP